MSGEFHVKNPLILFIFVCILSALCLATAASAAAVTASISTGPATAGNVSSLESEGYAAIATDDWPWLLSIAENGTALDPGNPVFYAMKGYAERKLGDYPAALAADTRSIEIQPNAVRYTNRGITYLALGNYTAALSDGQASVALDPSFSDAYALVALAYLGLDQPAKAQESMDQALALFPDSPSYWHYQGRIALAAGNCTLAISSLERSIALNPSYSLPWPTMANATEDLATAREKCGTTVPATGTTAGKAPLGVAVVILAAAGALLVAGRR
ncbi:tetratricopeptide (TPR) repeat protein [Methanolinea mesophila]|uniref:tetratricopeptide repeat protein n=1 Tax=Methanolinea mesophila TaxID=547055 RepID=UPI001AE658D7|nr:tetratricopeptide repeat protein [Methanolinea mesophila]MBP1928894.1 tetratricopeptide (TPR) repeat protein [Methanolinea mesophila]